MKTTIRKNKVTISVLGGVSIFLIAVLLLVPAYGWDRGVVTTFATLPQGSAHPEGITTDSEGNFYVVTWDYERAGKVGDYLYVGNLAVDTQYFKGGPALASCFKGVLRTVISQWAGEVKAYNIVRIPARIPPLPK